MNIEHLYKVYFDIYTKTNFSSFNINYVSLFSKSYLYFAMIFFVSGAILLSFFDNPYITKLDSLLNATFLMGFSYLHYQKYFKILKKAFITYHKIDDENNIDYIFYDTYHILKQENNFLNNKEFFSRISDIEIHKKSFFDSSLVLIIISIIIAFTAIIATELSIEFLVKSIIFLFIILLGYWFIYMRNQHFGRNKHLSFQLFILKTEYFEKNL